MAILLNLINTIQSKLSTLSLKNGQLIITRDNASLYVDTDGKRIHITDWIDVNTETDLLAILAPIPGKIYFTVDTKSIWKYINGNWVSLNKITKNDVLTALGYTPVSINGDASNLTSVFTENTTLTTINSGEKFSSILGKTKKAVSTLISHISTAATASVLGHVKVDVALSASSANPVQNKAVKSALDSKIASTGDASNTTVTYTDAAALAELSSGEKLSSAFGKLKLVTRNVISLMRLMGTTDISGIGGGTVTGAVSDMYYTLYTRTTRYRPLLAANELNDASYNIPYAGNIQPEVSVAVGLSSGWYAILHMSHAGMDGYCHQVAYPYTHGDLPYHRICRAGTWTPWTYFDGGTLPVIQPEAKSLSGVWMLPGQYMAGWGLVAQIQSCYPINMVITNCEVLVPGVAWIPLPAPSVPRIYQTYYVVFNASALGLTDGASYIVRFNVSLN